jgi:hypothetical protein
MVNKRTYISAMMLVCIAVSDAYGDLNNFSLAAYADKNYVTSACSTAINSRNATIDLSTGNATGDIIRLSRVATTADATACTTGYGSNAVIAVYNDQTGKVVMPVHSNSYPFENFTIQSNIQEHGGNPFHLVPASYYKPRICGDVDRAIGTAISFAARNNGTTNNNNFQKCAFSGCKVGSNLITNSFAVPTCCDTSCDANDFLSVINCRCTPCPTCPYGSPPPTPTNPVGPAGINYCSCASANDSDEKGSFSSGICPWDGVEL